MLLSDALVPLRTMLTPFWGSLDLHRIIQENVLRIFLISNEVQMERETLLANE